MCRQHVRRVGFHNTEAEKQGGLYVLYISTPPPHLFSIRLSHSLPSLSVCLLPDSQVCKELNLPSFPPLAAGMHVYPHPPHSLTLTCLFLLTSTAEKNYNTTPKLRKWIQSVFCFSIKWKNNSDLLQLGSRFLGFGHHLLYIVYENIVLTMCHDLRNYFGENNSQLCFFKATLINIFVLGKNQMVKCNVKGVAHIDKPTENHHPTAIFLSCRWWLSTQCFGFTACNLFGSISMISSTSFPDKAGSCYQHKKL